MSSLEETEKWREILFEETFDRICAEVRRQKDASPRFSIGDLEARLNDRYLSYGHGWDGGGPVQEVRLSAEIAALESLLAEWRGGLSPLKRI